MLQIGKPISDARDEVGLGRARFRILRRRGHQILRPNHSRRAGGFDFTLRQPMGVVACIVPWNFPFPIACWKVAPALAAGNSVVLKPASPFAADCAELGELAHEAGLPPGVLQVLPGSGARGRRRPGHPSARAKDFLHRLHRGRPPNHGARRAGHQTHLARARRQVAEHRLRRCRSGKAAEIADERLRQYRPGLLRPQPRLRRAHAFTSLRRAIRRRHQQVGRGRSGQARNATRPAGLGRQRETVEDFLADARKCGSALCLWRRAVRQARASTSSPPFCWT